MGSGPLALADFLEGDVKGMAGVETAEGTGFDGPDDLAHQLRSGSRGSGRLEIATQSAELEGRQLSGAMGFGRG